MTEPNKRYPRVEVIWEDHHSNEKDEYGPPSPPKELIPLLMQTTGYLVGESDSVIEIARDSTHDVDDPDVGAPIRILKKCIVYRKED